MSMCKGKHKDSKQTEDGDGNNRTTNTERRNAQTPNYDQIIGPTHPNHDCTLCPETSTPLHSDVPPQIKQEDEKTGLTQVSPSSYVSEATHLACY
jgi:hypothetical protein